MAEADVSCFHLDTCTLVNLVFSVLLVKHDKYVKHFCCQSMEERWKTNSNKYVWLFLFLLD